MTWPLQIPARTRRPYGPDTPSTHTTLWRDAGSSAQRTRRLPCRLFEHRLEAEFHARDPSFRFLACRTRYASQASRRSAGRRRSGYRLRDVSLQLGEGSEPDRPAYPEVLRALDVLLPVVDEDHVGGARDDLGQRSPERHRAWLHAP